ncbi:MAG: MATE family efflux transporter [Caulobacter sp.]|nr:MATE family efflux transporter [Caulobacter sp.]
MTDLTLDRSRPRPPWTLEAKALLMLAAPMALAQLAQMAIMTTDVILLGRLGRAELAAAAIGNTIFFAAWLLGTGPAMAVSPVIAQILGAQPRNRAGVRAAVRMGLWTTTLLSAPLLVLMLNARWILSHLGQDPDLARGAGVFVSMLCFGLPFTLAFQVLRNFTAALGKPGAATWVMMATILVNAVAGYGLIFGHFGLPKLGLMGSGLATSGSAIFSFIAMLAVIWMTPKLRVYRVFRRVRHPVPARLGELVRLGLPIGMTMIFEAMLFNTMTLIMGTFGEVAVAAHQIALNFASITFMVPLGIGMAATVRVGVAIGRGDPVAARRAGFTAMGLAVAFVCVCAAVMILFGRQIAGLYLGNNQPGDAEVIVLAAQFLLVAAAFQVFDAVQVVGAMALRGLKDARAPMILAGVSYWLFGAPMCILLGVVLNMQGLGVWIGLAFGLGVAAAAMSWRFNRITRAA